MNTTYLYGGAAVVVILIVLVWYYAIYIPTPTIVEGVGMSYTDGVTAAKAKGMSLATASYIPSYRTQLAAKFPNQPYLWVAVGGKANDWMYVKLTAAGTAFPDLSLHSVDAGTTPAWGLVQRPANPTGSDGKPGWTTAFIFI
jgi:hypothetical protein